jgi:hypothetical protein
VPGRASANPRPEAPTRTIETLLGWPVMTKGDLEKWEACRQKQTVATCAKAQPAYYAANKAMNEAARHAVGMK